jgi:hypothetical protein
MPDGDQGSTVMSGPTESATARHWKEILTALFKVGAFKLMVAGAVLGVLRSRLPAIPGFKAVAQLVGEATRS